MAADFHRSTGYYGNKIQRNVALELGNAQVKFMPPLLVPKLIGRVRKPTNVKQRRTENKFFLPSLTNRDRAQVLKETSPWKLSTSQDGINKQNGFLPFARDDNLVHGSLDRERYQGGASGSRGGSNGNYMSGSEDMDFGWNSPTKRKMGARIDKKIVHHLKKKLNRRIERHINHLVEQELSKERGEGDRAPSRRSSAVSGAKSPFDPTNSYNDFGEKIIPDSRQKSRSGSSQSATEDINELNRRTPLPDISKVQDSNTTTTSVKRKPKLGTNNPDEILNETQKGETGKTFALTGFARGGTVTEDDPEPVPNSVEPDPEPVSPVPTPLVFRPETRQQMRISFREQRDRLLEGDITIRVKPKPKTLKIFIQSCFSDTEVERTRLIEAVYPRLRSFSQERGFDLHISDPHWAHHELTSDRHDDVDKMRKIIDRCREHNQGINMIIFLGQKLGSALLPSKIKVDEFCAIVEAAETEKERQVTVARQRAAVYEETRRQRELEKIREMAENLSPEDEQSATASQAADTGDSPPKTTVTSGDMSKESTNPDLLPDQMDRPGFKTDLSKMRKELSFLRSVKEEAAMGDVDPDLLRKWYKLDENAQPPVFVLQRISSEFKDINSTDVKRRQSASQNWQNVAERLSTMLQNISKQVFQDVHTVAKFKKTLTEEELERGLAGAQDDVSNHHVWFYRNIDDIHLGLSDDIVREYQDFLPGATLPSTEHEDRLREWREHKIRDVVPNNNIKRYRITWNTKGVTMNTREHINYVDRLCKEFTDVISRNIDELSRGNTETSDAQDELYREVEQHVFHCHKRAGMFHGRKNLLNHIKRYVRGSVPYPLVLHGKAGCGKSSLVAKASKEAHKWIKGSRCVTIVRIISATAASTNVRMLLRYLCLQLCEVFGDSSEDVPQDYKGLFNNFSFQLSKADESRQLVIFLDSLHLLTDENEGRNMAWLPKELPPYVRLIMSTLPDENYLCFKALQRIIPDSHRDCFMEINEMPIAEAATVLDHWFKKAGRAVTKEQRDLLMHSYRGCQQPLYLRVLFNEALLWPSSFSTTDVKLGNAVKNLATVFIGRLERDHGEVLVRRALGYISCSRNGITESEMEDLLSLDDMVMADVMNHIKPSLRRLPSLLWLRLREDLGEYLEETNADGCVTLKWKSIQFFQAAEERYLANRDRAPSYHKAMAEYFMDSWTDTNKPYPGNDKGSKRYTMAQPLYREVHNKTSGGTHRIYNKRRLNELPYHFLNSQQMDALKSQCLCNFEFVLAKISGVTLRAMFEDLQMALSIDPTDANLKLLSDTLHLSTDALVKDPRQLASQVIGRLHTIITKDVPVAYGDPVKYPFLKPFFEQAQEGSIPALIPSITCLTPPGGILFDLLSGHTEPLTAVCMSRDGQKCVTTSKDNTLKLWELKTGRVVKTVVGVGNNVLQIQVGGNNAIAITSESSMIRMWSLRSGDCLKTIDDYQDPATLITASEGMLLAAFFHGTNIMRVWALGGRFNLHQEVFLDEEESSKGAIHQDNSTIVASNSHGPLVLHAYKNSSEAYVRNAKNGNLVLTLKVKESGSITAMACSPEYFVVATRYQYMEVHEIISLELFDNRNGAYIRQVRGCIEDIITELYVNHMGSHAVAVCYSEANNSSEIALWNLETQEHKHMAKHAKVSKHGACIDLRYCLTTAEGENTLRIWNLSGNATQPGSKVKFKDGLENIYLMANNSRYVIAKAMNNGPLSVWNIAKGKCAGNAVHIERGLVNDSDIMLARNTKVLILTDKGFSSVSEDRPPVFQTLLIYDLLKKKYTQKLNGCYITPSRPHEYVFLSDEHVMGLADNRSHLVVWSTTTGHVLNRIKPNFREFERRQRELGIVDIDSMRKANNVTSMMTPWDRRTETKSARERRRQAEIEEEKMRLDDLKRERENAIQQYMISKDLSTVVTSHYAHHLCVFDVESQSHTQTLEDYNCMMFLYTAALTPSGGHLVHTNYDENEKTSYVTLWDCRNGCVRKRLRNEKNVCCLDISDNARRIVFGKSTKELRIWEPGRTNVMKRIKGYSTLNFGVNSQIHMVEDGAKAVVFAGDISIWDLVNSTVLAVFTPDVKIQSFTIAMEGKLIVFGIQDASDVITLRLRSKDFGTVEKTGIDLFGEVESSDEEDDAELEAQLE